MRALLIGLLVGLLACGHATMQVALKPHDLRDHTVELTREGQAQIATVTKRGGQVRYADIETVFLGQTVTVGGATTTVADLLAACDPETPSCKLTQRDGPLVVLRVIPESEIEKPGGPARSDSGEVHTNGYNPEVAAVTGILALASLAGTVVCLVECDNRDWAWLPGGSTLVFTLIWAVASGARD